MTLTSIKDAFESAKDDHAKASANLAGKRVYIDIDPETYKQILILKSEKIFLERAEPKAYIFDENNKEVVQQLYYYITGSRKFSGSLHKGIHLWGEYGSGKTTLLQAVCEMITELGGRRVEMILAKEFGTKLLEKGLGHYSKRPLFVDDIGREPKEVKDFGNVMRPVPDLYYLRKENGAWTFQTCQRPIDQLNELYGMFTTDRMKAAFNEIHFKGGSRR